MSRIEKAIERANILRELEKDKEATKKIVPHSTPDIKVKAGVSVKVNNPYLVVINEPLSPAAEEYRKLKSMVIKLTKKGKLQNTIMVTSTAAGEGKTLTALNLAITLAEEYDHTVLLIDADLRQPSIHKYLGIEPKIGLADCLSNGTEIGHAIIKTGIGNLSVLAAGSQVSNPVELLLSNKMKALVEEMKHRYADRYIIFDTPPVLPFAEAHSIGAVVDGVIFVVREGSASINDIKEALNMLKDTNILGVTYNDADVSRLNNYYSYMTPYHRLSGKK